MERKSKYPLHVNTSIRIKNIMAQVIMLFSHNFPLLNDSNNNIGNTIITKEHLLKVFYMPNIFR